LVTQQRLLADKNLREVLAMQAEDAGRLDCSPQEKTVAASASPAVIPFDHGQPADYHCMGGKCASLVALIAAGVPVPLGLP
jgi:hypothetical protein